MSSNSSQNSKSVYVTDRLKKAFDLFLDYPCTVIEAPMGYGKTTAVKTALENLACDQIWQKVYTSGTSEFWSGFCQAISKIDENCGDGLKNIDMLETQLMKREIMSLLEVIKLDKATFLVIDDYHYVKSDLVDDILKVLITNMPKNLHVIIITRIAFLKNSRELQLKGILYHIGVDTLKLHPVDIQKYFRLLEIHLNSDEQTLLYQYSEGWISALYLLSLEYKLHGTFLFTRNIPELVFETVYDPLDADSKLFLNKVCLLDAFTFDQASYLWQQTNTKEILDHLISSNAFINFDTKSELYSFHNIFGNCLKEQFSKLNIAVQNSIWLRTAELFFKEQEYIKAMDCFYNSGHFEGVLRSLEEDRANGIFSDKKETLIRYYTECPIAIKKKHPLSVLIFALLMVVQFKELKLYQNALSEFFICIEDNPYISPEMKNQLLGEYEVLQTFTAFNDLVKIGAHNAKAQQYLNMPPRFINTQNSFTFGSPSILYLYYRESGKLSDLIHYLKGSTNYYEQNTGGHGNHYKAFFEAEWLYFTGNFKDAEIILHKYMPFVRDTNHIDIALCGYFFLTRIALAQGEYKNVLELIDSMTLMVTKEVKLNKPYWLVYALDICKGYVYAHLDEKRLIPDWVYEYEYPKHMGFLSVAFANILYGKALLIEQNYAKLLGLSDHFLELASIFPNLLAVIYTHVYIAIANYKINRTKDSILSLKRALDLASPDHLVIPFIENGSELLPILNLIEADEHYSDFIQIIYSFYKPYKNSIITIKQRYFQIEKPALAPREKEIALLALQGLNNKEIASQLYISENTVKAVLKSIFKKCNINSRVLLTEDMIQ